MKSGKYMVYTNTIQGIFKLRHNRFAASVEIEGQTETVHVKNTGRLGELLLPGARVALIAADNPNRKTKYDLISVYKDGLGWVNIDSQVTNKVVADWLREQGFTGIKPEYTYGKSRMDFYMEKAGEKYLLEVKGCTLEIGGKGFFPDAVTSRGRKHVLELAAAKKEGYHAAIAFVIAMEGIDRVYPNTGKDPAFAEALRYAKEHGVEIWHFSCRITRDSIKILNVQIEQ